MLEEHWDSDLCNDLFLLAHPCDSVLIVWYWVLSDLCECFLLCGIDCLQTHVTGIHIVWWYVSPTIMCLWQWFLCHITCLQKGVTVILIVWWLVFVNVCDSSSYCVVLSTCRHIYSSGSYCLQSVSPLLPGILTQKMLASGRFGILPHQLSTTHGHCIRELLHCVLTVSFCILLYSSVFSNCIILTSGGGDSVCHLPYIWW